MKSKYIIIIEVPHQRPVTWWLADNWLDAAIKSNCDYVRADKVRDHISHDLSRCHFITSKKELIWLKDNVIGHQKFGVIKAAQEALDDYGDFLNP